MKRSSYTMWVGIFVAVVFAGAVFAGVRAWKNHGKWAVSSDANKNTSAEQSGSTIVEDTLQDAEVVMRGDDFIVIRFLGKGVMKVNDEEVPVQEAATVFFRDDTKFVGTKREDIVVGDRVNVETKRDTADELARVEAIKIEKVSSGRE